MYPLALYPPAGSRSTYPLCSVPPPYPPAGSRGMYPLYPPLTLYPLGRSRSMSAGAHMMQHHATQCMVG